MIRGMHDEEGRSLVGIYGYGISISALSVASGLFFRLSITMIPCSVSLALISHNDTHILRETVWSSDRTECFAFRDCFDIRYAS